MDSNKNIRIIDIAKMAGVSVGTVDRVLHNRGRVSIDKKEKIERVLKEINYEPNLVARLLARKEDYVLAAIIPSFLDGDYWQTVNIGIQKAQEEFKKFNLTVDYIYFDQYDEKLFSEIIEQIDLNNYQGVLIATLLTDNVIRFSKILDKKEIPYIYIDSNLTDQNNLSYFGGDSFASGAIAAKLMMGKIESNTDIIIAHTKDKCKTMSTQVKGREYGFKDYLEKNKFTGNIYHIDIALKDREKNQRVLKEILSNIKFPFGGITFDSRIYELANLLINICPDNKNDICLIGYDSIMDNINGLKNDVISYLIGQRSESQGYDSLRAISNYILFKEPVNKNNYVPIDILIKENIDYYCNYKP